MRSLFWGDRAGCWFMPVSRSGTSSKCVVECWNGVGKEKATICRSGGFGG